MNSKDLTTLSEHLLLLVKQKENTTAIRLSLRNLTLKNLKDNLVNDSLKKVFWINLYNAFYQILREENIDKKIIYTKKVIPIANKLFSLDDIEHGILRRFRYKYSLGYFPNLFIKNHIKELALDTIDYRIHFALNCGAKSCPPIAFYSKKTIHNQLDVATRSFLESETLFFDAKKEIHTTKLFKWFFKDFGGYKGIKEIFKTQLNKDINTYTIRFKPYSWEDDLYNFTAD